MVKPPNVQESRRVKKPSSPPTPRCELPPGRLLYRTSDARCYVVVRRGRSDELWVVEEGWTAASRAAGPFDPGDALRALRLAGTMVPEGCEKGPWREGIHLFPHNRLPRGDFAPVEPASLGASVSRYSGSEMGKIVNEMCCMPSADPPRVDWRRSSPSLLLSSVFDVIAPRLPQLRAAHIGALKRTWNAHPAGSPILAEDGEMKGAFAIVDLPPTEVTA